MDSYHEAAVRLVRLSAPSADTVLVELLGKLLSSISWDLARTSELRNEWPDGIDDRPEGARLLMANLGKNPHGQPAKNIVEINHHFQSVNPYTASTSMPYEKGI